jgi:hypothetical protein
MASWSISANPRYTVSSMRTPHRLAAGFTIAAVLFAACVPGLAWAATLVEPAWVLLPCEVVLWVVAAAPADTPTPAVLPSVDSRGPPSLPAA